MVEIQLTAAQLVRLARANGKTYRLEVCRKCGKTWNISRQAKLPPSGYICPHCASKEKAERLKRFISYIKWLLITAAGVALYLWAADYAYMERGYKAYGGECFFLLLPLFWYLIGATVKDGVATVKEIFKEDL